MNEMEWKKYEKLHFSSQNIIRLFFSFLSHYYLAVLFVFIHSFSFFHLLLLLFLLLTGPNIFARFVLFLVYFAFVMTNVDNNVLSLIERNVIVVCFCLKSTKKKKTTQNKIVFFVLFSSVSFINPADKQKNVFIFASQK